MNLFQLAAVAIISVVLVLTIKEERPEMALLVSILAGVFILLGTMGKLKIIVDTINDFSTSYGVNTEYIGVLVRIIGIAYITEFMSEICRDAGQNSIASKLDLVGKVTILTMAIPIMISVMELLKKIAEGG